MKILTVLGTRPEAIKLAPVVHQLERRPGVQTATCVTAQHRDMLDQVLGVFGIVPDVDLDLMRAGQNPSEVAARVLAGLDPVLQAVRPDWVVVQGDTTTAMAAALTAYHRRVRVAHVEAGLRTGDPHNPFPEEMNRILADRLSDLHFAPTERARRNLLREGIAGDRVHVTGNTVVDALLWAVARPAPAEVDGLLGTAAGAAPRAAGAPDEVGPRPRDGRRLLLVTAHRRESFGDPLRRICAALRELVRRRDDVRIVYPVHPNPSVAGPVADQLGCVPGVRLVPPVDYLTLVHLMKRSALILTDSGGIQEEAPSLGVPVLVLRDVTERPEAVEAGVARLVGTDPACIVAETERLLDDPAAYAAMARGVNPFGDGHAAERIVAILLGAPDD